LEGRSETISMTGPVEEADAAAEEERGARTLFTASLCFLNSTVRFLVAIESNFK